MIGIALVASAAMLAGAAPAGAATYYATPSPAGGADCSAGNPCSIGMAATMTLAGTDADFVLLAPGTYTLSGDLFFEGTVQPRDAGTRPVLQGSDKTINTDAGDKLRDLRIEISGLGAGIGAIDLSGNSTTSATRLEVVVSGVGAYGVRAGGDASLLDSAVWVTSDSAKAVVAATDGGNLRNVTAVASGPNSVGFHANGTTDLVQSSTISNSIFRGTMLDLLATAGTSVDVSIHHSDFVSVLDSDGAGTGAEIDTSGGGNITGTPLFRNAAAGDFHQCPGSPTINAGTATGVLPGDLDLDFDNRNLGGAPDIGADEFATDLCTAPAPPAAAPVAAPRKKCKKGRKLVRRKGKLRCVKKKKKK